MVKSKKMSKSSIAIIVLALLLVLSMVMGLTGAWFTDKITGSDSSTLDFGKVELGQTSAISLTESRKISGAGSSTKTVDGDSWTVSASTFSNASNVAIYYYYKYVVDLYTDSDGAANHLVANDAEFYHVIDENASDAAANTKNVRSCFSASDSTQQSPKGAFRTIEKVGFLAGNESTPTAFPDNQSSYVITFDSAGTANFDAGDPDDPAYYIVVKLYVKAVQARNLTSAEQLADLLGYESYEAEQTTGISAQIDALLEANSDVELA